MARGPTLEDCLAGTDQPTPRKKSKRKAKPVESVDPVLARLESSRDDAATIYHELLASPAPNSTHERETALAASRFWQWEARIHQYKGQHDFARKASSNANDYLATAEKLQRAQLSDRVSELEARISRTRNRSRVLADLEEVS